jgi:hypothetical protein
VHKVFKGMILGACAMLVWLPAAAMAGGDVTCKLSFQMSGWSVFYKESSGSGTIKCSNGQSMNVKLKARGGGLTVGKSTIDNGHGDFSSVSSIKELLGVYASAEAEAGAVKSAKAQVVTKGEVSLALSGTGSGWDLGVALGSFEISRR